MKPPENKDEDVERVNKVVLECRGIDLITAFFADSKFISLY